MNEAIKTLLRLCLLQDGLEEFGDPSLRFFLAAKATKVYQDPGIQGAANKTFKYVLPHVSEALKTGTEAPKKSFKALFL